MAFIPSPQQRAIFDWVEQDQGSALIEAVAGAGKTTTLIEVLSRTQGRVLLLAYNKKIADEIKSRIVGAPYATRVFAQTFHSAGFSAIRSAYGSPKLDSYKLATLMEDMGYKTERKDLSFDAKKKRAIYAFATKAASLAKQRGIGVLCALDNITEWTDLVEHFDLADELSDVADLVSVTEALQVAMTLLKKSIAENRTVIDFDDMIYCPLIDKLRTFTYDWVLIDEAQDSNPARRALAKRFLKPGGRLIAVGDTRQAIYGFTGADSDAMETIEKDFSCKRLPLTVTYRCPKEVVKVAHRWVRHIEAHQSAPSGTYTEDSEQRLLQDEKLLSSLSHADAVVCRFNKPLVELAYALLKANIKCFVEGKDIGAGLLALLNRWKTNNMATLREKLEEYKEREVKKALAEGKEGKAETVADRVEILLFLTSKCATVEDARAKINSLFDDTPEGGRPKCLTLCSVHKSKGREWDRVFVLGLDELMPSRFARQDWQKVQEDNLCYVAVTRAKKHLVNLHKGI